MNQASFKLVCRHPRGFKSRLVSLVTLSLLTPGLLAHALAQAQSTAANSETELTVLEQKVTANDGAANSFFGSAVAINGGTALIGADGENSFLGAAYLFNRRGGSWTQAQKLVPNDGLSGDEFGYRVALARDTLVVTAFSATVNGVVAQGAAYVFTKSGDTWTQSQKLTASDGGLFDNFGASVALDGDTLVIGANGATVGDNAAQGAVYVFNLTNGVWTETQKLVADDGAAFDNFGLSVALQGSTVIAGSPRATINGSGAQGAAYVYIDANGTWSQVQKLVASDGAPNDSFGESVGLSRDTAIVGAYNASVDGHFGEGAAYVFSVIGGAFSQTQKLTASDGSAGANFGNALVLHGRTLLIGADVSTVGTHTSQGKAYIFTEPGASWLEQAILTASDGTTDDFFGAALALDGGTALVSTPHPTINGNSYQGAAYFYTQTP